MRLQKGFLGDEEGGRSEKTSGADGARALEHKRER